MQEGFHFLLMASIATTIVEEPNILLASLINFGLFIAAVLTETLSAPALKTLFISLRVLMPPPTVKGMKIFLAVLVMI